MKLYFTILVFLCAYVVNAQKVAYTSSNAHSHNDYEQSHPFWQAYHAGFGSIEADVFLTNDDLLVAHEQKEVQEARTLKKLYLEPMVACIKNNKGSIYKNRSKKLILLIDCKTGGVETVQKITRQLKQYPQLVNNKSIQFVITGNQPSKDSLYRYPSFVWFDGDINYRYQKRNLGKVALFSLNYKKVSKWNGEGNIDTASWKAMKEKVLLAHSFKKPIRFWGAPDNENAWQTFMNLGIDLINTDKIDELAKFIAARPQQNPVKIP